MLFFVIFFVWNEIWQSNTKPSFLRLIVFFYFALFVFIIVKKNNDQTIFRRVSIADQNNRPIVKRVHHLVKSIPRFIKKRNGPTKKKQPWFCKKKYPIAS